MCVSYKMKVLLFAWFDDTGSHRPRVLLLEERSRAMRTPSPQPSPQRRQTPLQARPVSTPPVITSPDSNLKPYTTVKEEKSPTVSSQGMCVSCWYYSVWYSDSRLLVKRNIQELKSDTAWRAMTQLYNQGFQNPSLTSVSTADHTVVSTWFKKHTLSFKATKDIYFQFSGFHRKVWYQNFSLLLLLRCKTQYLPVAKISVNQKRFCFSCTSPGVYWTLQYLQ